MSRPILELTMFIHNKRLQYTVRVSRADPGLANLLLEQFGGPQGELAAATRYFTQAIAEEDPGRKDMLLEIATEELSHLEVIGSLIAMLNRGSRGKLAEGTEQEADLYRSLSGAGNDSHVTQLLYGGGSALTGRCNTLETARAAEVLQMKQRRRIYYTESQKALMWERWREGSGAL